MISNIEHVRLISERDLPDMLSGGIFYCHLFYDNSSYTVNITDSIGRTFYRSYHRLERQFYKPSKKLSLNVLALIFNSLLYELLIALVPLVIYALTNNIFNAYEVIVQLPDQKWILNLFNNAFYVESTFIEACFNYIGEALMDALQIIHGEGMHSNTREQVKVLVFAHKQYRYIQDYFSKENKFQFDTHLYGEWFDPFKEKYDLGDQIYETIALHNKNTVFVETVKLVI